MHLWMQSSSVPVDEMVSHENPFLCCSAAWIPPHLPSGIQSRPSSLSLNYKTRLSVMDKSSRVMAHVATRMPGQSPRLPRHMRVSRHEPRRLVLLSTTADISAEVMSGVVEHAHESAVDQAARYVVYLLHLI